MRFRFTASQATRTLSSLERAKLNAASKRRERGCGGVGMGRSRQCGGVGRLMALTQADATFIQLSECCLFMFMLILFLVGCMTWHIMSEAHE